VVEVQIRKDARLYQLYSHRRASNASDNERFACKKISHM
jgi:hypothetical protein